MRGWGRVNLVCPCFEVYFLAFSTKCHFSANISPGGLKGRTKNLLNLVNFWCNF